MRVRHIFAVVSRGMEVTRDWKGLRNLGCWTYRAYLYFPERVLYPSPCFCCLRGEVIPTSSCVDRVSQAFPLFSLVYNAGNGGADSIFR